MSILFILARIKHYVREVLSAKEERRNEWKEPFVGVGISPWDVAVMLPLSCELRCHCVCVCVCDPGVARAAEG